MYVYVHMRICLEQRDSKPETTTEPDIVTNRGKFDEITTVHDHAGGSAINTTSTEIVIRKLCMIIQ